MQMDFYLSHDFALQSLSSNGSVGDAVSSMRRDSEGRKYGYSAGARFGFTFPSGMGLKTGLNYTRINRSITYQQTDGMGGMPTDTISGNMINGSNSYTYIDIPVLFSYEMSGYGPFYYALNIGPMFNMTLTTDGMFLNQEGTIIDFNDGAPGAQRAYSKTAGASLFASFGFHYVMNDLVDFVIEPNIRLGIGSITDNDYPLDENYSTVGLITGFRYKF